MAANKGKKFERQFKESAENDGLFVLRLNDTDLSFNGNEHSRFTLKNPYDFLIYNYPNIFCLELKSSCYSSIGIQRSPKEPEKMIKFHQINSLVQASTKEGVYAGFVLNFRDDETLEEETYFLRIKDFCDFLIENDKKSINKTDVKKYNGILVEQKKKRTLYTYNIKKMVEDIKN